MSYPKFKGRNLISSNSVPGMYLPSSRLANPNIHRLLKPGHLLNTALPKSLSPIFLRAEFPKGLLSQYSIHSYIQSIFLEGDGVQTPILFHRKITRSYIDSEIGPLSLC